MKKHLFTILFLILPFSLFSQSLKYPLKIETSTSSYDGRSLSEILFRPNWSDTISSELKIRYISEALIGPALESDPKTLLATNYSRWEGELTLLQRKFSLLKGRQNLSTAGGLTWWNENKLEKGYFSFGGNAQLMANNTGINYFFPLLRATSKSSLGNVILEDTVSYTPLFYYTLDQTIAIQPLIEGEYHQYIKGVGKAIFSNQIVIHLWGMIFLEWYYDITNLDFPFLALGVKDNSPTFYPISHAAKSINNRLTAGINFLVDKNMEFIIKVGENFSTSKDLESNISINKNSFFWQAALSIR